MAFSQASCNKSTFQPPTTYWHEHLNNATLMPLAYYYARLAKHELQPVVMLSADGVLTMHRSVAA